MSHVLVVAEVSEGALKKATLTSITFAREAARRQGGEVHGLVIGSGVGGAAEELAKYVSTVHTADDAALVNPMAEPFAHVVKAAVEASGATLVCMASTAHGKDLMPRAAALLGAGMASDVTGFAGDDGLQMLRPIQAGNVIAAVEVTTDMKVVTTRPTEFDAAAPADAAGAAAALAVSLPEVKTTFVKFDKLASERPELTDAEVVISGGRGLKEASNFGAVIEPLADKLN
ncbi:MAG: electron transfer flavoprotein subunit alpha/FixB family protein, partial [Planctomycetota bacterium]